MIDVRELRELPLRTLEESLCASVSFPCRLRQRLLCPEGWSIFLLHTNTEGPWTGKDTERRTDRVSESTPGTMTPLSGRNRGRLDGRLRSPVRMSRHQGLPLEFLHRGGKKVETLSRWSSLVVRSIHDSSELLFVSVSGIVRDWGTFPVGVRVGRGSRSLGRGHLWGFGLWVVISGTDGGRTR